MPAILMGWKVAPALLAGNTMVLKPASLTPLTALSLAAILEEAGLPPGVLNVITGPGEVVGGAIVSHPAIRKISFTGDIETGIRVMDLARTGLKEVSLELGGSDPMIVWKDADIMKAVDGAIRGRFYNAGQTCTAVKRLYIHEAIADAFVLLLKQRTEALCVGDGGDPAVDMGPLSGKIPLERIESLVGEVRDNEQGRIITGGRRLTGTGFSGGFFYEPTLVTEPVQCSRLLCDEVFGPVLPVMTVPDLATAIEQANSTRYGLGASVWTRDISVMKEVFSAVHAGVVWVNRHLTLPPEIPFGGMKASGIGRENGLQAYFSYTRTKALFLNW
jgi:acyl-CoA reductase-like NAD-dependent aldehyde dehydrogenase